MALPQVSFEYDLLVQTCCSCGIFFAFPGHWDSQRRKDHSWWYCPNGHAQHYSAETEEEKLKRKNEMLADQVRMERERREKAERKLKRVHRGVCPECNRSFANVERHMKSKHKETK